MSTTVVVRDYGCKIPINLAETDKIARAVLNQYPDQYISYLSDFVSNLFGQSMRAFLDKQIAGYRQMLANTDELNRVAWGAYIAVQGASESDHARDVTLPYNAKMGDALNQLTREGIAMTGKVSPKDVYDIEPCIRQHIETLTKMKDEWCRGFGSREADVLAMLWYANDQGRNLQADLRLMQASDTPDYDRVSLVVPINLHHMDSGNDLSAIDQPDLIPSIRRDLLEHTRKVHSTASHRVAVGNWSGNSATANIFLGVNASAKYQWGWGHPANLQMLTGDHDHPHLVGVIRSQWKESKRRSGMNTQPQAPMRLWLRLNPM